MRHEALQEGRQIRGGGFEVSHRDTAGLLFSAWKTKDMRPPLFA